MKEKAYHEQVNINNALKLREQLLLLPKFCREYFKGIEHNTSSRTRISYAYDLGIFFEFLVEQNPSIAKYRIRDIPIAVLDEMKQCGIQKISLAKQKLQDSLIHQQK